MANKRLKFGFYLGYFDSEYVKSLHSGILRFCNENNIELLSFIAGEVGDNEQTMNYQKLAVAAHVNTKNIDGLLFATGTQLRHVGTDYLLTYMNSFKPLPVVSIGYTFPKIPSVISDAAPGLRAVINHVINKCGCNKIALMGVSGDSQDGAEREKIFRETLEENGIKVDESLIMRASFTYLSATEAITEFHKNNPNKKFDAIIALNDDMAFACIDYLHSQKIRVPEDVVVSGFDDSHRSAFTMPSLTSVNQNIEEQGYTAAKKLYKLLMKEPTPDVEKVSTVQVLRQSTNKLLEINLALEGEDTKTVPLSGTSEWSEKSIQLVNVVHSYSNFLSDMNLDQFRHIIRPYLKDVDIPAAAVVRYKNPISTDRFEYFPLPSEAILMSAFDVETGYDLNAANLPIPFNPNSSLIPDGIPLNMHDMYVTALFRGTIQYGYIIFRAHNYDMVVNDVSCTMFASGLASSYATTMAENRRKILEKEYDVVNQVSVTDDMTGLLNRRGFITLGQKTLEVSEGMHQVGMVLFGDMDGLKIINDTFGHAMGDKAIKAEAKLLKDTLRSTDIIGRLGGDEFAVIAAGMTERKFAEFKKDLYSRCDEWNEKNHAKFELSISLGGYPYGSGDKGYDIMKLLERADEKLYKEKKRKKQLKKKMLQESQPARKAIAAAKSKSACERSKNTKK